MTAASAPVAGSSQGEHTESSASGQKPSKRRASAEKPAKEPPQKRRRRAFSCLSCQKLKCRCEYGPGAQGCHRCRTLRIECSLRGDQVATPPNPDAAEQATSNIEQRLQRYEDELQEMRSVIKDLTDGPRREDRQAPASRDSSLGNSYLTASRTERANRSPEYFSVPADRGAQSAPIAVLRSISQQITRGYRRLLGHIDTDLVQLQLLDGQTANELIQLFVRHQGHNLFVCGAEDLMAYGETRKVSAFLHSVCCLIGIVYRHDICGTAMHRQIYEQVRVTLGQALLSSPLNLEEINAVLLMSNNANTPSSTGTEYVDSWLLTGYCAKQAMLSISFSSIIKNIKKGSSAAEDHKAIHLWSKICLHHLHWAATTGRPSIIPTAYIDQCNILLSFYQATMQDGMLVAEILLYSTLHQKLAHQSYLGDGGECQEFLSWKEKWKHLIGLSTSSMLRIGYEAACLILAVRSLEEAGHAPRPRTFLSEADDGHGSDDESHPPAQLRRDEAANGDVLRANVCKYAMLVLQTFLEMPSFLMDAIPTCFCLCIGYCALVLAHYDESQSNVSDQVSLDLITRVDEWIRTSPGKAWSCKYGALARHKIESRINSDPRRRRNQQEDVNGRANSRIALDDHGTFKPNADSMGYSAGDLCSPAMGQAEPETTFPSFGPCENSIFPSMEDFFGGGFLDFMR
ncbi:hypothetical protein GGR52DRAFT_369858 [Hypoxylon sp. FL1284]|nr:hypothetical protein GGR52DRAFT_369858 [Hypoxylon sp. FL1284]